VKRRVGLVLTVLISLLLSCAVQAEDSLPEWNSGYWWAIQTYLDVQLDDPDSNNSGDMVIVDNAPHYICQGIESRTLTKGSMLTYDVYRLTFDGTMTGEGTADIELMDVKIPIELRNATETGETWVDTATLGTVFTSRYIVGELWAYVLFSWTQVGNAEIVITEEYEPVRDLVHFPIEIGNTWETDQNLYTYGRYVIDYDVGSGPQHEESTFDSTSTMSLTCNVTMKETYKTWNTYRVEGTAPDWDGNLLARYAPEALNMAYVSMAQIEIPENGITIREITQDLHDFSLVADPTPTPTATPDPNQSGLTLHLNKENFTKNDSFVFSCTVVNSAAEVVVDQYIILDVYNAYWFWPNWSETPGYETRTLDAATVYPIENILSITWPEVSGSATGLRFWGALLNSATQQLYGDFDMKEWGYF